MRIYSDKGIFIDGVAIDTRRGRAPGTAFITHGHSDHVAIGKGTKYLFSHATKDIIEAKSGALEGSSALRFGEKIKIADATASLHNSGHILGSAQVLVENGQRVAVTSDFKLQDSIIQRGAEILPCDILVIESTFGLPCYDFAPREQVYEEIGKWVKEKSRSGFVVLAGYALGKAQELTAIVNKYAGIAPLVHESIARNNRVYEQHGAKLGGFIELQNNLNDSSVLIMPPSLVNHNVQQVLEFSLRKKIFSGFATGWTFKSSYDKIFQLSDHADFGQLMRYVQEAKPKLVLTTHGFDKEFASYVQRRLGIPARPLALKNQSTLTEFA